MLRNLTRSKCRICLHWLGKLLSAKAHLRSLLWLVPSCRSSVKKILVEVLAILRLIGLRMQKMHTLDRRSKISSTVRV